jgi:hypothetical protein
MGRAQGLVKVAGVPMKQITVERFNIISSKPFEDVIRGL